MTTGGSGGSLQKVTLTKAAPTVSLTKGSGATGQMRVNLNWNAGTKGLFRKAQSIDLDLGCLYELTDGSKGVVQALGNAFGRLDGPPYIQLDGDDRSGSATGGENLSINLEHLHEIKRVLVFAFIYEGVPAWSRADGVVTLPAGRCAHRGRPRRALRLADVRGRPAELDGQLARRSPRDPVRGRLPAGAGPDVQLGHGLAARAQVAALNRRVRAPARGCAAVRRSRTPAPSR